ncbi:hypothetical protein BDB01DRAFT_808870 [Pilobolus umbonatus]|nr:hypothetical protein BDB01DRAFT_808870 [Pilobolus umbonatus]
MQSLPFELFEFITFLLDSQDHLHCLTVCKQWYTLFVPILYNSVHFVNNETATLFLSSIIMYSRCKEAGQYVKSLSIAEYEMSDTDFRDALVYCPRIESLSCHSDLIQDMLHPSMPNMKYLKYLDFHAIDIYPPDLLDCYYKYRHSLCSLDLRGTISRECTVDGLMAYLGSFTHLEKLVLEVPWTEFELDEIFVRCPDLKQLNWKGEMLKISHKMLTKSSVVELRLQMDRLCQSDIYYIRDKFKQLRSLDIEVNNEVDVSVLFELPLNRLKLVLHDGGAKDILDLFWKHTVSEQSCYSEGNLTFTPFDDRCMEFYLDRQGSNGMTASSIVRIGQNVFDRLGPEDYLDGYGHQLDSLYLWDNRDRPSMTLNQINSACPKLKKLTLFSVTFNHTIRTPHLQLEELCLDNCTFDIIPGRRSQQLFKCIELAYPTLQTLRLNSLNFEGEYDRPICKIQLPETGLRNLSLYKDFTFLKRWNVIVMKIINVFPVMSWYYSRELGDVQVTENKEILSELAPSAYGPLYILVSSTLEDVDLEFFDGYSW